MQLTQKEKMILEEQKSQEQLCIEKYEHGVQNATCPELKQLFTTLGSGEKQHLNTITSILGGTVPAMNQSQGGGQSGQGGQTQMPNVGTGTTGTQAKTMPYNKKDAMLCQDALATEKFVSGVYNTGVFEFRDTNIRQALNHIQKEEQEHGEKLYNYMASHGYYNTQS